MRALTLALVLSFLPLAAHTGDTMVRDRSGKIIEQWKTRGFTTEVRDRNGALQEIRTKRGNTIYVRDRKGGLLRTETVTK